MCRNIKTLYNYDPPASTEEIDAAALQFVRKISGYRQPSRVNQQAFDAAVKAVSQSAATLLDQLVTSAPPRDREADAARARKRSARRFG
ncbi:MAG: DUF2277 domain-containing protein [Xanthomonadales bacterium]|nr:DUF2277 domain-containing protein [Xanthomonadales bacterium]